jgi:lipoprotein NlpD
MKLLYIISVFLIFLTGCATTTHYSGDVGKPQTPGIYHEVKRGETLWYVSKIYAIDLNRIIDANHLPDASKLEVGQLIFIPGSRDVKLSAREIKLESFIWPAKGVVVSYFGATKAMAKNSGIDIQTRRNAHVLASRSGKVTFASDHMKGYGKTIIIDHMDGFQTVYAHNAENLVTADQNVKQGMVIAKAGHTGRAKKPTLHFEIRKKHKPQNPFYYLP